jgi:tetratricopeptide (TPR) repeat protein
MRVFARATAWCLAGFLGVAQAADTVEYGPPPAWVKAVTVPKPDGSMAEAPARLLLRNYQLKFHARGTELYVESHIRLQTPQGLQSTGNVVLPWKPETDVLTVHKCQLLRDDKVIDVLALGQKFEVLRREDNLEYAALDGVLTAVLQPAGMEVGDVLNLAFSIRRESSLISAPEMVLSDLAEAPALRVETRAVWDKSVPLRWRATQDVKGARELRVGKEQELTWSADNVEPLAQPTNVPARFWRYPALEFTTYASWNEVSKTLAPLYASAATLKPDSPLRTEARAIASATSEPVARIESALKLVQDRVRYVFLGVGDGNLNPANADLTWDRRFGDCKGKTALLVALLRELGIEAEPVLVLTGGGDAIADRLPMMGTFNHVIVRARAGDKTWWLDGAGSGTWRRTDMVTPNYFWGLPITARGDGLVRMISEPAALATMETSTFIDARQGVYTDAPFKVEMRMTGARGVALHTQLAQLPQARRDQELRGYWKKEYDFVEVKTVSMEFDDKAGAAVLRMEGAANMDWGGWRYTTDGMRVGLYSDYQREPGLNADAPFAMEHPIHTISRQRIELPEVGKFVTDGADYDVTLAGAHYVRHSKIEGRVFTGEVVSRSLVPEVGSKEMLSAQKQLQAMWKDRLDIVLSDYAATEADVAALRTRKFTDRPNLVWRGNIFLERQEYDAAFADFDAAVTAEPRNADALAHRGLAYYWKNDFKKARADFDAALAIEAEDAVALRGLAMVQRANGDYKAAVDSFTRSLRSDPGSSFALGNRAYTHSALRNVEAALADAAAAIKVSPTYVEMYDLRAWLLTMQGKETEALAELQAMLTASPKDSRAHWSASHNYSRLGRYTDAVRAMDVVIAEKPTAANYRKRAEVRDPVDFSGRIADLDAALKLEPDSPQLQLLRAQAQSEAGNHKAALEVYTLRLKTENVPTEKRRLRTLRGIEYFKLGDSTAGRKDLAAALESGADGDSYNNYCWYLAAARVELESALAACDKALSFAPKDAAFLDSRGFALLQLGRFDEAIAAYDAALALAPELPASLYGRGLSRKKKCGCADGDADIQAGARLDPSVRRTFSKSGQAP